MFLKLVGQYKAHRNALNFISSALQAITFEKTKNFFLYTTFGIMTFGHFILRPVDLYFKEINKEATGGAVWQLWMTSGYFSFWGNFVGYAVLFSYVFARNFVLSGPNARVVATTCMVTVFFITFLFQTAYAGPIDWAKGLVHHKISPIFYLVTFLLCSDGRSSKKSIAISAIIPLAFFFITYTRGLVNGQYPYFFVNTPVLGWPTQTLVGVVFVALFSSTCAMLVFIDKACAHGGGHLKLFLRETKVFAQKLISDRRDG